MSSTNKYRKHESSMLIWVLPMDRNHDNHTDIYDGRMANCCQKVRGNKTNQRPKQQQNKKQGLLLKGQSVLWVDVGQTEWSEYVFEGVVTLPASYISLWFACFLALRFCWLNRILVYVMLNIILFKSAGFYWPGFFSSVITLCYIYMFSVPNVYPGFWRSLVFLLIQCWVASCSNCL